MQLFGGCLLRRIINKVTNYNMTYEEESFVLDSLIKVIEHIRSSEFKQLVKETHENNIMLKQIIKAINTWLSHHNQENSNDFDRNVLANFVSNMFDFNKMFKRQWRY